ncbi:paired amphipathic helix protein Sin3-like 4 [Andrographis paniculata]|uniref:paired amphipathic helix protein Sin3-like 4 n=1 Tax=Andrographis paniculata TaxID=175694 RepID=UPI0021E74833|nr:paired amphipathic helix protein Sin3-like 4 [Andrographis paniculata]
MDMGDVPPFPMTSQLDHPAPPTSITSQAGEFLGREDAINYLQTVEKVFRGREDKFDEFIKVLRDFRVQKIVGADVVLKAKELFEGHWDLTLGLNVFLPKEAQIDLPPEEESFLRKKAVEFNEAVEFVERIKATCQDHDDDDVYKAFIDLLDMYKMGRKSAKEVYSQISVLFADYVEFIIEFAHFLPCLWGTESVELPQPYRNTIPFGDGGSPSNYESCTPSYRLLSPNTMIPTPSERTKIGDEVLNDNWICVASEENKDYSSKHMLKNPYEENLFKCEDERFELDVLMESAKAASHRIERLLSNIESHKIKLDDSFRIEDHLKAQDLRYIERLYGEHGLEVLERSIKSVEFSLPIMLSRLKQKLIEWTNCHAKLDTVWREINAKNYPKSLDYRSLYKQQADINDVSPKDSDKISH